MRRTSVPAASSKAGSGSRASQGEAAGDQAANAASRSAGCARLEFGCRSKARPEFHRPQGGLSCEGTPLNPDAVIGWGRWQATPKSLQSIRNV